MPSHTMCLKTVLISSPHLLTVLSSVFLPSGFPPPHPTTHETICVFLLSRAVSATCPDVTHKTNVNEMCISHKAVRYSQSQWTSGQWCYQVNYTCTFNVFRRTSGHQQGDVSKLTSEITEDCTLQYYKHFIKSVTSNESKRISVVTGRYRYYVDRNMLEL
jgi:hypothetical protein